jgi:hypothetical protein
MFIPQFNSSKTILCWLAVIIIGSQSAFLAYFISGCWLYLLFKALGGGGGEAVAALYIILHGYLGVSIAAIVGIATGVLSYAIFSSPIQRFKWVRAVIIIGLIEIGITAAIILNKYGYISLLNPWFVRKMLTIF